MRFSSMVGWFRTVTCRTIQTGFIAYLYSYDCMFCICFFDMAEQCQVGFLVCLYDIIIVK